MITELSKPTELTDAAIRPGSASSSLPLTSPLEMSSVPVPALPSASLEVPVVASRWTSIDGIELTQLDHPPIGGVLVSLRDTNEVEIAHTRTDSAGRYRFDDVPAGNFAVVFILAKGMGGRGESERRAASYWPGDSVVPTPVHTWRRSIGAGGSALFCLEGTLS